MVAGHPVNAEVATVSQSLNNEQNTLFNQGMYASQLQISLLLQEYVVEKCVELAHTHSRNDQIIIN